MTPLPSTTRPRLCAAFQGTRLLASGDLLSVARAVKAADDRDSPVLVFETATGRVVDLDLRGEDAEIAARYAAAPSDPETQDEQKPRGRGRPKLGVVAREITLLPRHWEWLGQQPGGASAALRRLVEQARRADAGDTENRAARDACYRFISAIGGDFPDFEEASRALFAGDLDAFADRIADWPADVRAYALRLATPGD